MTSSAQRQSTIRGYKLLREPHTQPRAKRGHAITQMLVTNQWVMRHRASPFRRHRVCGMHYRHREPRLLFTLKVAQMSIVPVL
jgi:hypothetical protein